MARARARNPPVASPDFSRFTAFSFSTCGRIGRWGRILDVVVDVHEERQRRSQHSGKTVNGHYQVFAISGPNPE
jgi:hypothetical protein